MKKLLFILAALMVASVSVAQNKKKVEAEIKSLTDSIAMYRETINFTKDFLNAHGIEIGKPKATAKATVKGNSPESRLKALQAEWVAVKAEWEPVGKGQQELFENHKCTDKCDKKYVLERDDQGNVISLNVLEKSSVKFTAPEIKKDEGTIEQMGSDEVDTNKAKSEGEVLDVVEQMPAFPGESSGLMKWISQNIKYPRNAQENGIQGRVVCTFVVERDGSVSDVQVKRSVDPSLDKEAVRVLSMMPKWTPGMQDGKPVRVKYTIPVIFRLGASTPKKK